MADQTTKKGISWTDETWNPIYGCEKVSRGCKHCYAIDIVAGLARKFRGKPQGEFYESLIRETPHGPEWSGVAKLHPERVRLPLSWRRPRLVFVNSLSDLFHHSLSDADIIRVMGVMGAAHWHTFQLLTKRPTRAQALFRDAHFVARVIDEASCLNAQSKHPLSFKNHPAIVSGRGLGWPLPNVWLGTSVENQEAANERIPLLLRTPAALRWLSCEPLLGEVDLCRLRVGTNNINVLRGRYFPRAGAGPLSCESIDWVVCGGESGPGRRDMSPSWSDSLQDQCKRAGVPFFFKQHSAIKSGFVDDSLLPPGGLVRQFPKGHSIGAEVSHG